MAGSLQESCLHREMDDYDYWGGGGNIPCILVWSVSVGKGVETLCKLGYLSMQ